jgi:hypothetical protein
LVRVIVIWEVLWFAITELGRLAVGFPMTTLELTTLTFCGVMIASSILWYRKPAVARARTVLLKDGLTVEAVRSAARGSVSYLGQRVLASILPSLAGN